MENIKYFIGPMSRNVVDAINEFTQETGKQIGLIPSRRQVEWDGGYVNNWTTKEFSEYSKNLILKRDHSGPGQGYIDDDGFKSLEEDCKYFNYIHIDPWKKYPKYEEGLEWTINMIEFCYNLNPNIQYEIGTEEAIRKFEPEELDMLLNDLHVRLNEEIFNQIKYLVIQSGTSLQENTNTGEYNRDKLLAMVKVAKSWNLLSKEHNGDYISEDLIKEKMSLGLDSINIAPEFGLIETKTYLGEMEKNWDSSSIQKFWEICYNSKRWEKWVNKDFNPHTQQKELIRICGHYVFSHPDFKSIKSKYLGINQKIKTNIKNKLKLLHGL
jgi:hypothetical protein